MIPIQWTCPTCGSVDTDLYDETALPYCERCGNDFDWSEVITPDQMEAANQKMIKQEAAEIHCPTRSRFEGDLTGCGGTNLIGPDFEGFYDCMDCGLFFKADAI